MTKHQHLLYVGSITLPKDKEHDYKVASLDIVSCPACMHSSKKQSGNCCWIPWAYFENVVRTNKIVRFSTAIKCSSLLRCPNIFGLHYCKAQYAGVKTLTWFTRLLRLCTSCLYNFEHKSAKDKLQGPHAHNIAKNMFVSTYVNQVWVTELLSSYICKQSVDTDLHT